MALVINDRVKETTTTTGTGAVSLGGAVTGFETFAAGVGNSNTTYYAIVHQTAAEFEVGLGTLDGDSSDLTRTTVISSSNSDSAVDFAAGTKDVFCTIPASKLIFEDANNDATVGRNLTVTGDLTVSGDDITMATNTSGAALIGDGTNFNPVAISGDISIAANGTAAIGSGVIVNADVNASAAIAMSKTAFSAGTGVSLSTNTLNVDAAQTGITSVTNTSLVVGRDSDNDIDFATDNNIIFRAAGADQIVLKDGVLEPVTDSDIALGTSGTKRFTNLFLSGAITTGSQANIGGNLNLNGSFEIDVASGDPTIIFDTQGADKFHIAVDDSDSDNFVIKSGGTVGSGNGIKMDSDGDVFITGDLTITGDDLFMGTNTDTAILVADGTNYNPVVPSGDIGLTNAGVFSISSGVIVNADINASAAIADSKLATISTAGKVDIGALEIDGATDIGAALADADLIIVDDGAGGTNRKATLTRLKTYLTSAGFSSEDPTALAIALG